MRDLRIPEARLQRPLAGNGAGLTKGPVCPRTGLIRGLILCPRLLFVTTSLALPATQYHLVLCLTDICVSQGTKGKFSWVSVKVTNWAWGIRSAANEGGLSVPISIPGHAVSPPLQIGAEPARASRAISLASSVLLPSFPSLTTCTASCCSRWRMCHTVGSGSDVPLHVAFRASPHLPGSAHSLTAVRKEACEKPHQHP